jgi:hypothetical protein
MKSRAVIDLFQNQNIDLNDYLHYVPNTGPPRAAKVGPFA